MYPSLEYGRRTLSTQVVSPTEYVTSRYENHPIFLSILPRIWRKKQFYISYMYIYIYLFASTISAALVNIFNCNSEYLRKLFSEIERSNLLIGKTRPWRGVGKTQIRYISRSWRHYQCCPDSEHIVISSSLSNSARSHVATVLFTNICWFFKKNLLLRPCNYVFLFLEDTRLKYLKLE